MLRRRLRVAATLSLTTALAACGSPAERADDSPEPVAGSGLGVFTSAGCGSCHTLSAAGEAGGVGPNLARSLRGKDARYIRSAILDPQASITPGYEPIMPNDYGDRLSPAELDALVGFLDRPAEASPRQP